MRSPNFPGIPLGDAVKAAGQIYDRNRRNVIERSDAAKDLGYTGLTGRSLKILGALNQYDLIENVSKGQLRVTKTAEDNLHGYPDQVKVDAHRKAGRAPTLFNAIFDRFEGGVPGDNAINSFLIQSGFTNEGAQKALRNFSETNRYLEIAGASESYGGAAQSAPESPPESDEEEAQVEITAAVGDTRKPATPTPTIFRSGPLDFNLSSAGLQVTGRTTSASELNAFIEKLKALAVLLPDSEDDLDAIIG
jgi:hypothetical protein